MNLWDQITETRIGMIICLSSISSAALSDIISPPKKGGHLNISKKSSFLQSTLVGN